MRFLGVIALECNRHPLFQCVKWLPRPLIESGWYKSNRNSLFISKVFLEELYPLSLWCSRRSTFENLTLACNHAVVKYLFYMSSLFTYLRWCLNWNTYSTDEISNNLVRDARHVFCARKDTKGNLLTHAQTV